MSTANFDSRQLGFPLYVHDNCYSKVCPECSMWNTAEAEVCQECGHDLSDEEPTYDECDTEYYFNEADTALRRLSEELEFFNLSVVSGYYCGFQFDVTFKMKWGCELDPEELDNEDAHYYFDCCRSEMLRRYQRERRKLGKKLAELADFYGFEEIVCVGIFSNGEAVYERAGTLRAAAKAI